MSGSSARCSLLMPSAVLALSRQQAGFGGPSRKVFLASKGAICTIAFSACSDAVLAASGKTRGASLMLAVSFLVRNSTLVVFSSVLEQYSLVAESCGWEIALLPLWWQMACADCCTAEAPPGLGSEPDFELAPLTTPARGRVCIPTQAHTRQFSQKYERVSLLVHQVAFKYSLPEWLF